MRQAEKRLPNNVEGANRLQPQFLSEDTGKFTPLAGAVFCGTPKLVETVLEEYKKLGFTRDKVGF